MECGDGVSEKTPLRETQKWRMESSIIIEDLASVELPTGSAQQSEPLCCVLVNSGCTTKVYSSCSEDEKSESRLQQEECDKLYQELFNNSNEFEGFEGFESVEDSEEDVHRSPVKQKKANEKWSTNDNLCLMKCYYESKPNVRGYRRRMHNLWKENGKIKASEQQLCDQARNILKKGRLSTLQLEEVMRAGRYGWLKRRGSTERRSREVKNRWML